MKNETKDLIEKLRFMADIDSRSDEDKKQQCLTWIAAELIEQLQTRNAELLAELESVKRVANDKAERERELVAHVERVKQMFITLDSCHLNSEWNENSGKLRSVMMQTPAQSLAEHDAKLISEQRKRWAREDAGALAKRDAEVARVALMSAQKAIPAWDCSCGHWLSQYATQYIEQLNKGKGDE